MNAQNPKYDLLEPPQRDGEIGRLGPYRVLALIGKGGMGQVFRAEDMRLKRSVALKLMKPKLASTPASRKRFIEEARSMAAVQHDNVATIFEVGVEGGVPFMAMELLEGESLKDAFRAGRKFEIDEILRLGKEVASGLAAAHECGLIHRDIKPANIWIQQPSGRAKILDFGLAIAGNSFDPFVSRGTLVGSPGFLSPEQARNEALDDRTDLYSLGAVLFMMCSGTLPLTSGSISGQLIAIICYTPTSLTNLKPETPVALSELIDQLLLKEPKDRPATASEVASRLDQITAESSDKHTINIVMDSGSAGTSDSRLSSANHEPVSNTSRVGIWAVLAMILLVCVCGAIYGFIKFNGVENGSAASTQPPKTVPRKRITAASLRPLTLINGGAGSRKVMSGQAARYKLRIANESTSSADDPRVTNSSAKVVAQLVTLLKQTDVARVERPTFPKKISPTQIPRRGSSQEFEVQFLTANLIPGEYEVEFQLQTPDGDEIASITDSLVIQEDLSKADLLGFEMLRTHRGKGADTYVQKNNKNDFGGNKLIQGARGPTPPTQHIYLRFDLSKLSEDTKQLDRAMALLTVAQGGQQTPTAFTVYGIVNDLEPEWQETGEGHLNWDAAPCRNGISGQKYLGRLSFDNTKDRLKNQSDAVRFASRELDDFIRDANGKPVTLVFIPDSNSNRAARFKSKEGQPDESPAIAIRYLQANPGLADRKDEKKNTPVTEK
ncbi:MAG: protein kinase domain-containing protein [Rubripirellula sp.]